MKIHSGAAAALSAAVIAASGQWAQAASVFSDNLTATASTTNQTSVPSGGHATSYDVASAKYSASPSPNPSALGANGLALDLPVSTSAITEAQAIFTTTPINLVNVGDNIELTVTFTTAANTPVAAYFGLYNSGGVAPATDLANGGLSNTLSNDATGGAQNYLGYVANVQNNTATKSKIQTRPAQTATTNIVQDLVSAGASGSQSYAGATQMGVASSLPTAVPMLQGGTFTEDFLITVTAAASGSTPIQYALDSNLYSGTTATGTALITIHGTDPNTPTPPTAPAAFGYDGFDAFAFGYRENNSTLTEIDYSSVTVSSNTVQSLLLGDANGDNKVDLNDLNIVLNNLGTTSSKRSDGNFDGAATIDLNDLNDVLNNLGTSQGGAAAALLQAHGVPEPASLGCLGIAVAAFLRRKPRRS